MEQATLVAHNATTESAAPVEVTGLTKTYRQERAVESIDLRVARGELFGLIGPDGAGKSTVLRSIAGVLKFDSGTVSVLGHQVRSERTAERVKHRLGLMPEGLGQNLYGELSVEENVDYFARLRLVPANDLAKRKKELLQVTGLDGFKTRPMKQLSGGMKQKLGLVCTLIHYPDLLLLDEPTTGVDPVSRRDFWSILTSLIAERSITAIVSTAYMDEAVYCDRLALMIDGRVLAMGDRNDLVSKVDGAKFRVRADDQIAALNRVKQLSPHVELAGSELQVFVPDMDEESAKTKLKESLDEIDAKIVSGLHPDLEDVLVAMMTRRSSGEATTGDRLRASTHWGVVSSGRSSSESRATIVLPSSLRRITCPRPNIATNWR